jgi:hypothetical protein
VTSPTWRIDLGGAAVFDNHCHGFRNADLLALPPEAWESRLTMMGMCFASSGGTDPALARQVEALLDSTLFALTARRWLAARLGCEATPQALAETRQRAYSRDPAEYVAGLLAEQHVVGLIADEGYPQPTVTREEFERQIGTPVYRVARIEPWIVALQRDATSFDAFEQGFEERLDAAAADRLTVGYKSIIAYRTGLDVTDPSRSDAAVAFGRWRDQGWPKDRGVGKTVRDYLLRATLRAARRHDRVMHLHVGGGDPDIVFGHVRPQDVYPLLHDHMDQPIVMIHGGYPWLAEAAYIASILPFVYLDLSEFLPWASLGSDRELETLLGVVPTAKLLYGSDEASEPEVLWLSARMAREALERVLGSAVDRDLATTDEALAIGRGVLGSNSMRLHGIGG